MSVSGFDIGNKSCVIAVVKRGEIDVALNDESQRETPSVVSFGEKQRFVGSALATANPKSTISQIKRLIGKLYNQVQDELKMLPFVTVEGPRGGVLIELEYLKQKWTFTPVEILGMLFTYLKQTAEKDLESPVVDCVIGIPSYFTDLQRRLYLDAACIAGLKPLQLMHDGTAIALGYGMYKTDFSDSEPNIVMFVDIGHCDTQVTVAAFGKGKMNILSHSFDQNLGGRDFDEVLYQHFAAEFNEKYKIDVYTSDRASVRLRASCEKVKKVLSANAEAQISIECLIGDTDVKGVITREEFENLCAGLLDRIRVACIMGLKDSDVSVDQLYTVELVGSGSRIPAITRILTTFFKKEPTRTLNASECVAKGCALGCAMLSPNLHVRDYKVHDIFAYSIVIPTPEGEFVVFEKGGRYPLVNPVGYDEKPPFSFEVKYSNETDVTAGVSPMVGSFQIGESDDETLKLDDVQLRMCLNNHGIVEIVSARGVIELKTYKWRKIFNNQLVNLGFSRNLQVSTTSDELCEAQKKEKILVEQDLKVEQTKDQRNSLESFVYETRNKLSSVYKSFVTELEKEVIFNSLKETEDWLYEDSDDDDDESEQDYAGKLNDLKELLEPIENKYHENAREKAEKALKACAEEYLKLAADSLSARKKQLVKIQCVNVENWLNNLDKQGLSPASLSSCINDAIKVFESHCKCIMGSKPYDEPEASESDQMEQPVDSDQSEHSVESDQVEPPVGSDQPLDVDKAGQPVDSDQKEQHLDSDMLGQPVDSDQEGQHVESEQTGQHVESEQMGQHVKSDQTGQPVDSDQAGQPVPSDQAAQHVDSDLLGQPVDSDQKDQHVDSDEKDQHVDSDEKVQLVETKQTGQHVESDQTGQPVDSDQTGQPVDSEQMCQPLDSDQREQPVVLDLKEQHVDSDLVSQPVDPDQKDPHVDSYQKEHLVSDQSEHFARSDQLEQPVDSNKMEQPVESDQSEQPVDSNQLMEPPVDTDQREQPVFSNQGDQLVDSVHMELVGLIKHMTLR